MPLATNLKRYKDIARLFVKYGRGAALERAELDQLVDEPEAADEGAEPKAEELADDLEALGPTFVKLGQILSTRADLLPVPYLEALSRLQDDVDPFPFAEVEAIVQQELGVRLSKAFSEFDPEPLAAASLGQVHRAALRDGRGGSQGSTPGDPRDGRRGPQGAGPGRRAGRQAHRGRPPLPLRRAVFSALAEFKEFVEQLPARANKILDLVANSELQVKVETIDERLVLEGAQKIANRITLGLILAALIVGAAMLMRSILRSGSSVTPTSPCPASSPRRPEACCWSSIS